MSAAKDIVAKLKDLKGSASPDACEAILKKWIAAFDGTSAAADALETLSVSLETAEPSRDKAPAAVLEAVLAYRANLQNLAKDLTTLRSAILLRIPEIKEEDNLGVNVQLQVLAQIKAFNANVTGGASSGKEDSSSSGTSFPSVCVAKDYLSARAAIEEKLLGSEKDGPSKSVSLLQQLSFYDADTVARLSRGYREVLLQQQYIVSCMTLNYKKLYAPRVERVMH